MTFHQQIQYRNSANLLKMCLLKIIQLFLIIQYLNNVIAINDSTSIDELEEITVGKFTIEGKVYSPELYTQPSNDNWQRETKISINDGEYRGFLREDGTFIISQIPSGSYVVEIINPDYFYEAVRVEINAKGKFRARKLNYIQPSQIVQVPYPLKLKALTRFKYFHIREQWKITDFLFSPMVLMMLLPLLLMLVLPKMMSDPETKKEMENLNLSKMTSDMPEISEMITSFFTGGAPSSSGGGGNGNNDKKKDDKQQTSKSITNKQNKKRN